mgnify:CR=1 FL=1
MIILVSLLPINSNSLVYGSSDGGMTIMSENDSKLNEIVFSISNNFSLAQHPIKGKKKFYDNTRQKQSHFQSFFGG